MGFLQREYETVILGALLHDIGKMLQRGSFGSLDTKGQHPQVSATFVSAYKSFFSKYVDYELLLNLVKRHHENTQHFSPDLLCQKAPEFCKPLCYLVSRADNYSSSERGEKAGQYQDFKATPLTSVFSSVQLNKTLSTKQHRYRTNPFKADNLFPDDFETHELGDINKHLRLFGNAFAELKEKTRIEDFQVLFSHVLSLLLTYSWCFPSNTQEEIPDVSLYDHLKTTCAIAACLYHYHCTDLREDTIKDDEKEKFFLLVGDLSGIQKFIFDIKHIGAGGTAKRLRARSFQISIISEMVTHQLLHMFNIPSANVLMGSGGKFYILLPNLPDTKDRIDHFQSDIDGWFQRDFNAEINLNIAYLSFAGKDFKNYNDVIKRINTLLQYSKRKPFRRFLHVDSGWDTDKMVLDIDFANEEKLCKACAKFPGRIQEDGKYICDRCNDDKIIGQKLPKSKYVSFYRDETAEFRNLPGYSFSLFESANKISGSPYLTISISENQPVYNHVFSYRPIANYVPSFSNKDNCETCEYVGCQERLTIGENQPKLFQCIAHKSSGRKMLGYLKADVDNLGGIFAFGFKENASVSRISTLSRMLDEFFADFMHTLMQRDYPDLYTVYSGGDDVLIIGPWERVIDFAGKLNSEFHHYTCNNDNITLSAGIAFVKHGHPVYRSVESAETELKESKKQEDKNRITLFGETIAWDTLSDVVAEGNRVSHWIQEKSVSVSFVRNLMYYYGLFKSYKTNGNSEALRFIPLLTYDIARNLSPPDSNNTERGKVRIWAELLKNIDNPTLNNLGTIVNYALNQHRGGRDE